MMNSASMHKLTTSNANQRKVINHIKTKQIGPQPRKERTSYSTTSLIISCVFLLWIKSSLQYLSSIDFKSYVSKSLKHDHMSQGTAHNDSRLPKEIISDKPVETDHQYLDGRRDNFVEHGCIAAARAERKRKEENGSNYANDYLDIASLEANNVQNTEAAWMTRLKKAEEERKRR